MPLADVIHFKHITLHKLRMKFSASTRNPPLSDTLRKEYEDGHFQRIEYSENHTMLLAADGAIIGIFFVKQSLFEGIEFLLRM
jgi:hypothetical protein